MLEADSIIACEVLTPAGNWSSYPPHKHDEHKPGQESELEEIYYFELQLADGPEGVKGNDPIGYQRVYGTEDRPIDVLAEVRTGDLVLVPHGWHGPAMAPPGYDMYYLNVMAGPGAERAVADHATTRSTAGSASCGTARRSTPACRSDRADRVRVVSGPSDSSGRSVSSGSVEEQR